MLIGTSLIARSYFCFGEFHVLNVKDAIAQVDNLVGKTIELEGEFIILQDREQYITYIFSPDEPEEEDEPYQIAIEYSLAELKTIMPPLPSMQLIYQGQLTHAPYFWRFPIQMTAQLDMNASNKPVVTKIMSLKFDAPYTTRFLRVILPRPYYTYQAEIDYDYEPEELQKYNARAIVKSQRTLTFVEDGTELFVLRPDNNYYARNIINQKLQIPGWLRYLRDGDSGNHFLLRTFAIRSSMLGVGILKGLTSIWWQPSPLYKIVRANMPIKGSEDANLRVLVTGRIDYLSKEIAPQLSDGTQPKLVFTEVDEIIIYEENFLL